VIAKKTPEDERCDGEWVVATEQVRDLDGIPRRRVYLHGEVQQNDTLKRQCAYKRDFLVEPAQSEQKRPRSGT
jgi:hypothetical protein